MNGRGHSNERGSVLVIVAVTLTALLGMGMIVMDVANWWVHKRHLQGQVDAAALAGAQLLRGPCTTAVANLVANEVQRYAGTTSTIPGATAGQAFGSQISLGGGETVLGVLNSRGYPDSQAGGSADSEANTGNPCTDSAVDVKLTDRHIPNLFPFIEPFLGHVNVHARVGLFQAGDVTGVLPFGITDPTPTTVVARLVRDSGATLPGTSDIPLTQTAPGTDPGEFDSASQSITIPPGDPNSTAISGASKGDYSQPAINVRIAASANPGAISADCSGATESCYATSGTPGGLIQLRGWPQHAPTNADVAVIKGVQLAGAGGGCGSDGYFSRIPSTASPCTVTVTVTADFQSGVTLPAIGATPTANDQAAICLNANTSAFLTSKPNGGGLCGSNTVQLTRGADTGTGDRTWTATIPVPDESTTTGPTFLSVWGIAQNGSVTLAGTSKNCTSNSQNPCVQTPIPAQKFFSGSYDLSGYLDAVSAVDPSSYSQNQCLNAPCALSLQLKSHFKQLVPAQSVNDPLFSLHLSGSQSNQTIDCGDGNTQRDQITFGCTTKFRQWRSGTDPDCATVSSYASMTSPFPCGAKGTGVAAGQVGQGMQSRITGGNTCPTAFRNHWSQYPWTTDPSVPLNDHRLVPVFITRFGSFGSGTGNGNFVRITGFGLFYITGWTSSGGNDDPCKTGTPGTGATLDDNPPDDGTIVGHFVNLVDQQFTPDPSSTPCDLRTLSICAPVLTD